MAVSFADSLANLERLARRRREAGRARAEELRVHVPEAARLLVETHGAEQVYLFGSLARGDATETSDVDLAVTGLHRERFFDALAMLMALFRAPVDLVRLEDAPASLQQRVHEEGERIR